MLMPPERRDAFFSLLAHCALHADTLPLVRQSAMPPRRYLFTRLSLSAERCCEREPSVHLIVVHICTDVARTRLYLRASAKEMRGGG